MNKICIINQRQGLGDILYIQKIIKHYSNLNYEVLIPVINSYISCNKYLGTDKIKYVSVDEIQSLEKKYRYNHKSESYIFTDNFIFLPLCYAAKFQNYRILFGIMTPKYKILKIDDSDYNQYININRDKDKELKLFNLFNINKKFILSNRKYSNLSIGGVKTSNFKINSDLRIIDFDIIQNFTIFDWIHLIEQADEIHTVATSLIFLLDSIDVKVKGKISIYSRDEKDSKQLNKHDKKIQEFYKILRKENFE